MRVLELFAFTICNTRNLRRLGLEKQAAQNQSRKYNKEQDAEDLVVAEAAKALVGSVEPGKIHQEANHRVHEPGEIKEETGKRLFFADKKHGKKDEKSADRLKELRWVERDRMHVVLINPCGARNRKTDSTVVGRRSVTAAVHKAADPRQHDSEAERRRDGIGVGKKRQPLDPEVDDRCDQRTDKASVHDQPADAHHAVMKRVDNRYQVTPELIVVENHIVGARTDDGREDQPDPDVRNDIRVETIFFCYGGSQQDAEQKRQHQHEPIGVYGKIKYMKQYRMHRSSLPEYLALLP